MGEAGLTILKSRGAQAVCWRATPKARSRGVRGPPDREKRIPWRIQGSFGIRPATGYVEGWMRPPRLSRSQHRNGWSSE